MKHYIYTTTCKITNNFYTGMHSTNNMQDGYLGSGNILQHSINKYGKNSHTIEILEFFSSRIEASRREKEIVNEEYLKNSRCMNIVVGGEGGNKVKWTEEKRAIQSEKLKAHIKTDLHKRNISAALEGRVISKEQRDKISKTLTGRTASPQAKLNMSESQSNKSLFRWKIKTPKGSIKYTSSLKKFCLDHDFHYGTLYGSLKKGKIVRGNASGWQVISKKPLKKYQSKIPFKPLLPFAWELTGGIKPSATTLCFD